MKRPDQLGELRPWRSLTGRLESEVQLGDLLPEEAEFPLDLLNALVKLGKFLLTLFVNSPVRRQTFSPRSSSHFSNAAVRSGSEQSHGPSLISDMWAQGSS